MWWWFSPYRGPSYQSVMTLLRSRITYFGMAALGLLFGFWFVLEDQDLRATPTTFRKAPCVIEDSDVEIHGRNRWGAPTSFAPVVTFTFTAADGREHTVTGYRLHEDGMSMNAAASIADHYEPGQQTWCYYDPADPERAVLNVDPGRPTLGWLAFLSVLLLLGGLSGLIMLHFVEKASRPPALWPEVIDEALRPLRPAAPADGLQAAPPPALANEGVQGPA